MTEPYQHLPQTRPPLPRKSIYLFNQCIPRLLAKALKHLQKRETFACFGLPHVGGGGGGRAVGPYKWICSLELVFRTSA